MSRADRLGLIAAAAGALGCIAGAALDPRTMLTSYLVVAVTIAAISMGALGVLMISYLVRGGWTRDLHPSLAAAARCLPVAGALFIPVLLGVHWTYPWAAADFRSDTFQATYLAAWFFVARTIFYFALWTVLAAWLLRAFGNDAAMKRSASVGLIVYPLTVSFAGVDWLESIEPHFHSSIYGFLFLTFVLLTGQSFGLLALLASRARPKMRLAAHGALLLSILLLWAYNHAMQYIIIWAGNIPEEVDWYLVRLRSGWGYALWALFVLQFIIPFFALLSIRVRGRRKPLLVLAGGTLALRFLEAAVLVLPAAPLMPLALLLDLPAVLLFAGGLWFTAWRLLGRQNLTPPASFATSRQEMR